MKAFIKESVALILLFSLTLSLFIFPVYAEGAAKSKYYKTVSTVAGVSSSTLEIHNAYTITGAGFTSSEIHTYVERRVLGIFWVKVDNGQTDKTWIDTSTTRAYGKNYSLSLSQTGTYRVTAEFTFYGSNGSESITRQETVTY